MTGQPTPRAEGYVPFADIHALGARGAEDLNSRRWSREYVSNRPASGAIDGDCHCLADLPHSRVGQSTESSDQDGDGDALDGVEVDDRPPRYGIVVGLEKNLAREASYGRRTRRNECSAMSRDHGVPRQDHYWTTTDLGHLTPPDLSASRYVAHEDAADRRHDARSPHSSGSSTGWSS
jgi:hypothetical protein